MALIENLITFFGIDMLSGTSTFVDLINVILKIGFSVWIVAFVIRSICMVCTLPNRRLF